MSLNMGSQESLSMDLRAIGALLDFSAITYYKHSKKMFIGYHSIWQVYKRELEQIFERTLSTSQ